VVGLDINKTAADDARAVGWEKIAGERGRGDGLINDVAIYYYLKNMKEIRCKKINSGCQLL